ncbi:cobalamin biosynthesis protein [Lentilactobacillus hilgardii]|nr:cobalamin biosynthesis protein [Lentilactobacillus hilgardii]MCP9350811.1 cobalamin biosynthesis protein [Lentilactobacillus hilgardii]MCP9353708.1 cobalamin biosynthesis protein [Lentilactobacillus hilgardii]
MILHFLKCKEHRRVGIIVNDLATVNVDEKMIEKNPYFSQADRIIALTNGSISGNLCQRLVDAVYDLAVSRDFDLILIESSGIVQPDMVAKFISRGKNTDGRRLSDSCRLDTNVTIVDGFRVLQQFMPGVGECN